MHGTNRKNENETLETYSETLPYGARIKPDATRTGTTTKFRVGPVTLYITVNGRPPLEVFAKCDEGHQAEADGLAEMASLALQYGCPASVVAAHLRFRRYAPHGAPGQSCSISDAIGQAIEEAGSVSKGGFDDARM